ncbi:aldose epimerase family protein [Mucilaginibacter sabulilitoris]|uniref:Aldose 1-epimerase n=1 Tax=Mucilaginibacter sabulilitoris TaxID=1173583 RepID=A0ABZ0TSJ7_9SPHI|nr:aldose epimerase family protein [Mucilaginibacter sabulilitoris]WPU96086.1 aldose epimerase family protein [Mucilaginibacter sabulilitoris]
MKTLEIKEWGTIAGQQVFLYTLSNKNGTRVVLSNIGAAIQSVFVKDKNGNFVDVVLGYDTIEGYANDPFYIGTVVGRYANRIAGAKVDIDGTIWQLTAKEGGFHHHGGREGFNKKVWTPIAFDKTQGIGLMFSLLSPDGDEGFPGNLQVKVKYTLNDDDRLIVEYECHTDKSTVINLTQHTYFNLAGHNQGSITGHYLKVNAAQYLPVNDMIVPNGNLADVIGSPFDFSDPKQIGRDIDADDEQVALGSGYDHSWVLKNKRSPELLLAAQATESTSGRKLTVYTTEPALHIYTGNFLDGSVQGKDGYHYQRRDGFCLETQNFPDSPNKPHFPSAILKAGELFSSKTIFEFGLV